MIRSNPYLSRMTVFLVLVVIVAGFLHAPLVRAFLANPALNGLILAVLLIGIGYVGRQVLLLRRDEAWIRALGEDAGEDEAMSGPSRLLAPLQRLLAERRGRLSLSALSMRTLLDTIGARLDESRELSRYLIGLLIFLGLLGTFWGLLQTVSAVGEVIAGLSVGGTSEIADMFDELKRGLEQPLGGMGTAFSSSLLGLGGSLVLGFLDLQAGQAQNRFFNRLEEWLAGRTRLTGGMGALEAGEQPVPAYVGALLERTADSLDELQRTIARGEDGRAAAAAHFTQVAERMATLTDQMRTEQELMARLAETQSDMKRLLQRLSEGPVREPAMLDEASRSHLRNLDVYMTRLLEETVSGRTQMIGELRGEIRMLARTIAGLADEPRPR